MLFLAGKRTQWPRPLLSRWRTYNDIARIRSIPLEIYGSSSGAALRLRRPERPRQRGDLPASSRCIPRAFLFLTQLSSP
jgi:hypothetical protein